MRTYRLRIRNAADSAWEHTFTAFFKPPQVGGQRVYVLAGRTSSKPWVCEVVDDAEDVTGSLAESIGTHWRYTLMRRRADVSQDDGAGYTVLATARVADVALSENQGVYRFTLHDERFIERSSTCWTFSNTTSVWPMGRISEAPFTAGWSAKADSGPISAINFDKNFTLTGAIPEPVRAEINSDVKPGITVVSSSKVSEGSFHNLRLFATSSAHPAGDDYEVIGFWSTVFVTASTVSVTDEPLKAGDDIKYVYVFDPDHDLASGSGTSCYLHFPSYQDTDDFWVGRPPNENVPLHIEGQPFSILQAIWDGDYGGTSVNYNSAQLTALQADDRFPPNVLMRVTRGPQNTAKAAEQLMAAFLTVPLINSAGEVYPQPILLPDADTLPDVSALTVLDGANLTAPVTWELSSQNQITRVSFRFERYMRRLAQTYGGFFSEFPEVYEGALDMYDIVERVESHDDTRLDEYGIHEHEVWLPNIAGVEDDLDDPGGNSEHVNTWGPEFTDRFADGAPTYTAQVDDTVTEAVGDFLVIDCDETFTPNAGIRAESRLVQVVSREPTVTGAKLELLDTGPYLSGLSQPSVAVTKNATDPRHTLRVTMSGLGTNKYELQMSRDDSTWWNLTSGDDATVDVGGLQSGETYYVRVRAILPQRIRSAWSTSDSATLDSYGPPTGVSATATNNEIALSWTAGVGSEGLPVEVWYDENTPIAPDTTGVPFETFSAGTTSCTINDGLATSTLYYCGVRHLGPYGGYSTFGTDSDTTGVAQGTLAAPDEIYLERGISFGTRKVPA